MTEKIIIRPYQSKDHKQVVDLVVPIQTKEFNIDISLAAQPDLVNLESFYGQGSSKFWVASIDDEVIGTVALIDLGDGLAALRKMFVKKDYRGTKNSISVASMLLETLITWAKSTGIKEIWLGTTLQFQAAQRFYEKNSFLEVSENALPVAFPRMAVDSKFYFRKL
jgi:N-acetylglutamate synthase-like GNAT family acetyltransferase